MLIKNIVLRVNQLLSGELLSRDEMTLHLDAVIDDINTRLSSSYPAFSELPVGTTEYSFFPDRFIRTVVCVGAAYYFYQTDEEGSPSAQAYSDKYQEGLFYMLRDFVDQVPEEYCNPSDTGAVNFNLTGAEDNAFNMGGFLI